uniref:Protein Tat n=2 Tax=Equine infectious anemia virus TaxID=11665 RepID=K7WBM8_9RETR|nr:tat [Equine infectious anemia virus]AFW99169.1 tat [Equine infectious anemia virus]AFW99175.1 tat [Equine infectious anemia virus]AFW99181.1 tat [Equine infectious anemia virus]AIU56812.1 tat protein [Equine infectious anemia virus]
MLNLADRRIPRTAEENLQTSSGGVPGQSTGRQEPPPVSYHCQLCFLRSLGIDYLDPSLRKKNKQRKKQLQRGEQPKYLL